MSWVRLQLASIRWQKQARNYQASGSRIQLDGRSFLARLATVDSGAAAMWRPWLVLKQKICSPHVIFSNCCGWRTAGCKCRGRRWMSCWQSYHVEASTLQPLCVLLLRTFAAIPSSHPLSIPVSPPTTPCALSLFLLLLLIPLLVWSHWVQVAFTVGLTCSLSRRMRRLCFRRQSCC